MSDPSSVTGFVARHAEPLEVSRFEHRPLQQSLSESYVLASEGRRFLSRLAKTMDRLGWGKPWVLRDGIDVRSDGFVDDALILLRMDSTVHVRWHADAGEPAGAHSRARWASATFVGGAVLGLDALSMVPGQGSYHLTSSRPVSFYLIPLAVLDTLAPEQRRRLSVHLRAETAAALSPSLQHIVARQRARLAAAIEEVTCDAIDGRWEEDEEGRRWKVICDYDAPADALYLIGRAGSVLVSRRWRGPGEPDEAAAAWRPDAEGADGAGGADSALAQRRRLRSPLYGRAWLPVEEAEFTYHLSYGDVFGVDALEELSIIRERIRISPDTRLFRITRETLESLYNVFGLQLLRGALESLVGLYRRLPLLIASAKQREVLGDETPGALALALSGAQLLQWRVGNAPPPPLGDALGACFMLDGELLGYRSFYSDQVEDSRLLGAEFEPLRVHARGDCFGVAGLGKTAPFVESLRARTPTWLAFVSNARMINTLSDSVEARIDDLLEEARQGHLRRKWQRAMLNATNDSATHYEVGPDARAVIGATEDFTHGDSPPVVVFQSIGRLGSGTPSVEALMAALVGEVERQFDEPCLMVIMKTWGATSAPAARRIGARSSRLDLDIQRAIPSDGEGWRWLLDVIDHVGELASVRSGYIFLYVADNPQLGERLGVLADRVVYLSDAELNPRPPRGASAAPYIYTAIRPLTGGPPPRLSSVTGHRYLPSTVRLGLTGGAPEAGCLARWARAVTNRRVGIALGGGGAWGMAHVAVLRAIHQAGVPIDLISGSSVGASVGAFYCALGLDGLDLFINRRLLLQVATLAGMVTSTAFVAAIAHLIGDVRLEEMLLPFFPVSTDLSTGSESPVMFGPAAFAARKSGSLAPVYPATPTREGTFVDGGISRNVPVALLETEGARLIVASNIVPPPAFQAPRLPRFPGRTGRILSDLSPTRRGEAALKSALTLFYNAGTSPADDAAVTFESQWTGVIPLDLLQGPRLIEDVQSTPAFWQTVHGLKERWERLSVPRREKRRE